MELHTRLPLQTDHHMQICMFQVFFDPSEPEIVVLYDKYYI